MSITRTKDKLEVDGNDLKALDKIFDAALNCLNHITPNSGGLSTAAAAILIIKSLGQI